MSEYGYIVGRVATPPTGKFTPTGKQLTEFRFAVDGAYDKAAGKRTTDFYDVTVWEPQNEIANDLNVGAFIYLGGTPSVYRGTSGDRKQFKASELGTVERLRGRVKVKTLHVVPDPEKAPSGVEFDDESEEEW
jgi:single-stranded DNA-binding protein